MTEYVPASHASAPPPHRPASRRRAWPFIAAVVALAAALSAVLLWPHAKGDKPDTPAAAAGVTTFAVNGTLALGPGQFLPVDGTSCAGTPVYRDLVEGAPVTITDPAGAVLGSSRLGPLTLDGLGGAGACNLKFTVPGIPTGKGTYGIEVARRGVTRYDEAKLRSGPLQLSVS
jgi:hypothetical protein